MLDQLRFAWPWAALALLLPVVVATLLPRAEEIRGAALRVPFFRRLDLSLSDAKRLDENTHWRLFLGLLVWVLLVTAACRPQWISAPVSLPVSGRDLMLAIDLSASMDQADMIVGDSVQTRIRIVKQVAQDFISRRIGDRVGLILFGSQAYLQAPLTFDRKTVQQLLQEANTTLAGPSTAIGDAIGLAIKRLRQRPAANQVLILLTDGESNAGVEPLQAAHRAKQAGIRIYTIGVGSLNTQQAGGLDEASLIRIARSTRGRYFRALDAQSLETIYRLLDQLEPAVAEDAVFRVKQDLFHWPLGCAFLLLTLLLLPVGVRGYLYR